MIKLFSPYLLFTMYKEHCLKKNCYKYEFFKNIFDFLQKVYYNVIYGRKRAELTLLRKGHEVPGHCEAGLERKRNTEWPDGKAGAPEKK